MVWYLGTGMDSHVNNENAHVKDDLRSVDHRSADQAGKLFWQCSHWYGFSLVWVPMWFLRASLLVKHSWQCSHWHLTWFLLGVNSTVSPGYLYLQNIYNARDYLQWYGVSLVWILYKYVFLQITCICKIFLQCSHWYSFSLWCILYLNSKHGKVTTHYFSVLEGWYIGRGA